MSKLALLFKLHINETAGYHRHVLRFPHFDVDVFSKDESVFFFRILHFIIKIPKFSNVDVEGFEAFEISLYQLHSTANLLQFGEKKFRYVNAIGKHRV